MTTTTTTPAVRRPLGAVLARTAGGVVTAGAVLGLACLVVLAVCWLTGMRTLLVVSGSMAPGMPTGSLAVTRPVAAPDVHRGQVVSVDQAGGTRITHRVVGVARRDGAVVLTTRGDANQVADPTPRVLATDADVDVVWASVPRLGYATTALRTPWVMAAGGLLVVLALWPSPRRRTTTDEPAPEDRS